MTTIAIVRCLEQSTSLPNSHTYITKQSIWTTQTVSAVAEKGKLCFQIQGENATEIPISMRIERIDQATEDTALRFGTLCLCVLFSLIFGLLVLRQRNLIVDIAKKFNCFEIIDVLIRKSQGKKSKIWSHYLHKFLYFSGVPP